MIPGSPLVITLGPGVGKRSRALAVRCPHCGRDPGVHCYVYTTINRWEAKGHYTPEFHQARIDLSRLCPCGQPAAAYCGAPLSASDTSMCDAPVCAACAVEIAEHDYYMCPSHARMYGVTP